MMVETVQHFRDGKCIWEAHDLPNVFHLDGQQFVLQNSFDTDGDLATVPSQYYLGLDDRDNLSEGDDLEQIDAEPSSNGYARQSISSSSGFSVGLKSGTMTATSGIVSFIATSGPWGPVQNVFLATSIDGTGTLIASTGLSARRTVLAGDSISVRINLSLSGCT